MFMFILFNKVSRPYVYSLPYICLWLEEYFFKSRPVLLKDLDHFGHPLLRDAQLASFLVTSVDNNIYFGAPASSVTKKKKEKRNNDKTTLSIISIFTFLISQKCYNLQQSVKSPIAKIHLLSCPFQDSEKRQEDG